jgi:TorA maturation chaperone TorD
MFASGLFAAPTNDRIEILQNLLIELLSVESPWKEILIAFKKQLNYSEANEVEYSRLFILAFPHLAVQPFGSYWLEDDQALLGKSSIEIKNMMAEYGIEIAEDAGLLPDHIVSELEFMAYLASLDDTKQTQYQLLEEHLALWTPQFTDALRDANPAPYYQLSADFLDKLIQLDVQEFGCSIDL